LRSTAKPNINSQTDADTGLMPMSLTPFQLSLYGLPNEVGPFLAIFKNGVYPGQRPLGESGRHLFMVDQFSAHGGIIYMISPIDKPYIGDIMYP
jgi:hypothetical protein